MEAIFKPALSDDLGGEIVRLLGMKGKGVTRLTLDLPIGKRATVTVERFLTEEEAAVITEHLKGQT
jgi:hypothetical protein